MTTPPSRMRVRGAASAEELAAVLAALAGSAAAGSGSDGPRAGLAGWRATRVAAVRRTVERGAHRG